MILQHRGLRKKDRAELAREKATLAKAQQDIVSGERLISDRRLLIDRMIAEGQDVSLAQQLLETLSGQLEQWYTHLDAILDRIAVLENGASKADSE